MKYGGARDTIFGTLYILFIAAVLGLGIAHEVRWWHFTSRPGNCAGVDR